MCVWHLAWPNLIIDIIEFILGYFTGTGAFLTTMAMLITWIYVNCLWQTQQKIVKPNTVGCRYNTVQHNMILRIVWQRLRQNMHRGLYSQKTPHISPSRVSYWMSCEDLDENWPRYSSTALYMHISLFGEIYTLHVLCTCSLTVVSIQLPSS